MFILSSNWETKIEFRSWLTKTSGRIVPMPAGIAA